MLQHSLVCKAAFLALLPALAIPHHGAQARSRDDLRGTPIVELMQKYGQPDRVAPSGRKDLDRAYHWRLKTTAAFEGPDQSERREDFFCEVTAIVGQSGRIKAFEARPADVGAGALASTEAFGPLCRKAFGARPGRARAGKPARMRL
jgi:hypothetical protein